MAKKQAPAGKNRNQKNSKIQNKNKSKNSTAINSKSQHKSRNKTSKIANGDASSEETEVLVVPSSSTESNDEVVESIEAEEDGVDERSPTDEDEKKKKLKSSKKKGKKEDVKNKGKKRSKKEEDEEETDEKSDALYRFPMNRVNRIIRSENPDIRIAQEAIFLINKASEKFLQVFCREAYACAFIDRKSYTAYNHLSSVVSKRKRFSFLTDFVPDKVKAEEALAQISDAEK